MKKVLSVILALAMVFSMSIMVSAATTAEATVTTSVVDGKLVLSVAAKGDLAEFDFGISYSSDVKVDKVSWNADFNANYSDANGIAAKNDNGGYVVLGGTAPAAFAQDGEIATITCTVADPAAAKFVVVKDSAALIDAGVTADKFADVTGAVPVEPYAPATDAPATDAPATDAPTTAPTQAPVVNETKAPEAPATVAPTVAPTATTAPTTADTASVVIPVVAIVAAAALVVVSKKRIEE